MVDLIGNHLDRFPLPHDAYPSPGHCGSATPQALIPAGHFAADAVDTPLHRFRMRHVRWRTRMAVAALVCWWSSYRQLEAAVSRLSLEPAVIAVSWTVLTEPPEDTTTLDDPPGPSSTRASWPRSDLTRRRQP